MRTGRSANGASTASVGAVSEIAIHVDVDAVAARRAPRTVDAIGVRDAPSAPICSRRSTNCDVALQRRCADAFDAHAPTGQRRRGEKVVRARGVGLDRDSAAPDSAGRCGTVTRR